MPRLLQDLIRLRMTAMTAVLLVPLPAVIAMAGEPNAEQMMVSAHEARATWEGLPGFTAEIVVSTNGDRVEGQLSVTADGELNLDLPKSSSSTWVERRLQSLVSHRMPRSGERHFDVSFVDDVDTHPLGRLIRFHGDRLHSVYRIQGDVIREVHRTMGDSRFTISVIRNSRNENGKQLPHVYTVSWWDTGSGHLKACEVVTNEWIRVGEWDLPAKLLVVRTQDDSSQEVREVVFHEHRLLTNEGQK